MDYNVSVLKGIALSYTVEASKQISLKMCLPSILAGLDPEEAGKGLVEAQFIAGFVLMYAAQKQIPPADLERLKLEAEALADEVEKRLVRKKVGQG